MPSVGALPLPTALWAKGFRVNGCLTDDEIQKPRVDIATHLRDQVRTRAFGLRVVMGLTTLRSGFFAIARRSVTYSPLSIQCALLHAWTDAERRYSGAAACARAAARDQAIRRRHA